MLFRETWVAWYYGIAYAKKREVYLKIKASPPSPLEFFLLNWLVSRCFLLGVPNFETILGGGFIFFGNFHPKNWGNDPI